LFIDPMCLTGWLTLVCWPG